MTSAPPEADDSGEGGQCRDWRLRDGAHWQIESSRREDRSVTDEREGTTGACQSGMVEVQGRMKDLGGDYLTSVEYLQNSTCDEWLAPPHPARCARFDSDAWQHLSRRLKSRPLHFCIDRFEYPNERGASPWIFVTWNEARGLCAREGKRLCTEREWTFACEGEEALPYPYGYSRDSEACVIDRPRRQVRESSFRGRTDVRALFEIDRLWQGEPSGARPRCRSPFGVFDMTGNIDEWVVSIRPVGHRSILKGGYWGPVRNRCRAATRVHDEGYSYYQQGLRCCSDTPRQLR